MAANSLNAVLAGMQEPQLIMKAATGTLVSGRPHSLFYTGGVPAPGVAPSSGVAGGAHSAPLAGCIPFVTDVVLQEYLARLQAQSSAQAGTLMLCDRLWSNSALNVTLTTSQTVNSVVFPERDRVASPNGDNVLVGMEVSSALGAGTPTLTLGYTNAAGDAGRSGTNIHPVVASSIAGTFYPFGLQSGDRGVRSIQTFQSSATMTSGAIHLVAYRVLAMLELDGVRPGAIDALTGGRPEMFPNTCLWPLFIPRTTTSTLITGHFIQTNC